jgi:S-adenosylmethionine hydrolase
LPFYIDANTIPSVKSSPVVACITDFGTSDYYAGALRGVLAGLAPAANVIDITHEIPPGDIRRAALVLWESRPAFPEGTIFLVVVDPGVGGARLPAAFQCSAGRIVCPDNGIATFFLETVGEWSAVEIRPRSSDAGPVSNTFHGRDVFAPAAARLCNGEALEALGPELKTPVRLPLPRLAGGAAAGWEGEILYCDRFGNAVTSIGRIAFDLRTLEPWLPAGADAGAVPPGATALLADGRRIPLRRTYGDADAGGPVALAGSNGLLEIASPRYRPSDSPALRPGASVRLIPAERG